MRGLAIWCIPVLAWCLTFAGNGWAVTPKIIAGENHTIMLRGNGSLWASGDNSFGQLGDGSSVAKDAPVQIGTATDWVAAASGIFHTLALKADGSLWGWGDNTNGQLGLGITVLVQHTPVRIGSATWKSVATADFHTVAVRSDGTLWAWGEGATSSTINHKDDLAYSGGAVQPVPLQVGTDTDWVSVAARSGRTMALKSDGSLWGMGGDLSSQLGDGANGRVLDMKRLASDTERAEAATSSNRTSALREDGSL